MTSPLFPFETERHRDETIPSSAHPIHFTGPTDPALDPDNEVAAGKMWRQSDDADNPTWCQDFFRSTDNTAWIACGPPWVIADYTEGQVPVADEFGRLAPGDVSGGESGPIDGSGVTNTLAKWQDSNTVVESSVTENATDLTSTKPLYLPASTTSVPSVRLPHGSAPSSPTNGDVWTTTAGIFVRINGTTVGPLGTGGGGGDPVPVVQIKVDGNAVSGITLAAAPASGNSVIMVTNCSGGTVSAISSTNTTWTELADDIMGAGPELGIWIGQVSGGAGGTAITVTHSGSFMSLTAMELEGDFGNTPVQEASADFAGASGNMNNVVQLTGCTPGNLIILGSSPSATNGACWAMTSVPSGGLSGAVVSILVTYAPSHGVICGSAFSGAGLSGGMLLVEVS